MASNGGALKGGRRETIELQALCEELQEPGLLGADGFVGGGDFAGQDIGRLSHMIGQRGRNRLKHVIEAICTGHQQTTRLRMLDERKARIANAKAKSAYKKALKEAQAAAPPVAATAPTMPKGTVSKMTKGWTKELNWLARTM